MPLDEKDIYAQKCHDFRFQNMMIWLIPAWTFLLHIIVIPFLMSGAETKAQVFFKPSIAFIMWFLTAVFIYATRKSWVYSNQIEEQFIKVLEGEKYHHKKTGLPASAFLAGMIFLWFLDIVFIPYTALSFAGYNGSLYDHSLTEEKVNVGITLVLIAILLLFLSLIFLNRTFKKPKESNIQR